MQGNVVNSSSSSQLVSSPSTCVPKTKVEGDRNYVIQNCEVSFLCSPDKSITPEIPGNPSNQELNPDTLPQGFDALANVGYNKLKYRIAKQIKEHESALEELKCYCASDYQTQMGIPKNVLAEVTSEWEFLECLERCQLLGPRNLIFLQFLLHSMELPGLVEEVANFARRQANRPLNLQMVKHTLANGVFNVTFHIYGKRSQLMQSDVDEFRQMLSERFDIEEHLISVVGVLDGSVILVFQLPCIAKGKNIFERLQNELSQNLEWQREYNIISWNVSMIPDDLQTQEGFKLSCCQDPQPLPLEHDEEYSNARDTEQDDIIEDNARVIR